MSEALLVLLGVANGCNTARLNELTAIRKERFDLMERLARLPDDMVFFTQITMEAAEDTEFLDAMKAARIKGALVGVESVTPSGLKDVYKDFNLAGDKLIERLQTFRQHRLFLDCRAIVRKLSPPLQPLRKRQMSPLPSS